MSTNNNVQKFDVIIVGAGVPGLITAIELSGAGLQVALLEAKEFRETSAGKHVRVSAINIVSERILRRLHCWDEISTKKISPFREITVSDAEGVGRVLFSYRDVGREYLGNIVANEALIQALLNRAKELPNLFLFCPVQINVMMIDDDVVKIKCSDEAKFESKLLVGADGAESWVRKTLNIPVEEMPYHHTALVATVKTENAHGSVARQRFRENGPIAFLPLENQHHCSIVWSTIPEEAEELMGLDVKDLGEKMAGAIDYELGEITVIDKPIVYPLIMRHAAHYVHPRVALIGDAAHTIHPLAGQGLNLGILDAACLSEVVMDNFAMKRDIGLVQNLRRYERWRRSDNQLMIEAMRFFKEGFALQQGFLKNLRDITLKLTNRYRWLRRVFMHQAMGFRGELPNIGKL
ncbi:MAG: UbiH/UbiF/VisC/COQ6 family ubiquinone biosynthesis hydroxylase [Gammaproteobacteria bacterium]|nr:UbiH/UbiF/VisC/COQ6 family ubiquinone biosynthesis hydroxylase [Gammaproteobacteria bacterium]